MKKGRIHFGLLYLGLILILIPASVYILASDQKKDSLGKKVLSSKIVRSMPIKKTESRLKDITADYFAGEEGRYSVFIKNLKTDEEYEYNSKDKYDSASLYKLWVMAVTYQKIKDGSLSEEDVVSAPIGSLEETLSTSTPTPTPEGFSPSPTTEEPKRISMTIGEAIERMITYSDNYSALLLASKSGSKDISNFLKENELRNSNFKQPPQTTAEDIGVFYEKLYKGEIVDEEYSKTMISLLKRQTLNDRIPKYLDDDIEVAHKTGELFGSKHDAGIVFAKEDYIIVVLTETKDYKKAAENIAKYSEEIYKYFEKS